MSGELQTIPARHGVATFVPRGRTIKVINTYGKQVVSMWAFTLGPPPEEEEEEGDEEKERGEEEVKKEAEKVKGVVEGDGKEEGEKEKEEKEVEEEGESAEKELEDVDKESSEEKTKEEESTGKESQDTTKEEDKAEEEEHEDPPEQAPDTPENEKTTESTESASQQPSKRTWSSYLPSIPYRNKGKAEKGKEPNAEEEKAQSVENTKRWSSYLPTGKAISSYVPNVQLPDSKNVVSAFKATHPRDPNKSYAEQLYDFSKTPVGAGTIAAATGSGYASSVYAAYSAYTSTSPFRSSQPPMEFLSLPHTRASSYKLVPEVNDELLTNLRNPIITLIEDTTPGAHDTLTAACDANLYTALGVDKPEEHGSCAENLVIALKELNESAGLKGAKAIGADVSVNVAPTPFHLFMNAPLQTPSKNESEDDGLGAKGTTVKVAEPAGKKRSFVRFRAERDVVIVFSACPMDIGPQNGGRCMAANFMVEDVQEGEDLSASVASMGKKKAPKKISKDGAKKGDGKEGVKKKKKKEEPKKAEKKEEKPLARRDSGVAKPSPPARKASEKKDVKKEEKPKSEKEKPKAETKKAEQPQPEKKEEKLEKEQPKSKESNNQQDEDAKPAKKKPKKLQVRSKSSQNVTKTAS